MVDSKVGSVTETNFFDVRFLNPFEKYGTGLNEKFYGSRYGNVQFIYIACALISLICVFFYSSNKSKLPLQLFFLLISYFLMYYNLSCLLIPNNHERCYIVVWMFLLSLIMSTVLTIFGDSLFKNINNFIKHLNKKTPPPQTGGKKNKKVKGGAHCYKKDDEQKGGAHCYKKDDEQKGGGYGHKKEYEQIGSSNCNKKNEQDGGLFKY